MAQRWIFPEVAKALKSAPPDTWPWQLYNIQTGKWETIQDLAELDRLTITDKEKQGENK